MNERKCDLCGVRLDQQYVQYNRMLYCIPCHLAGNRNARLEELEVACLGIVDPETTVPMLVAMCRQLRLALEDAAQYKGDFLRRKHRDDTLLADTDDLLAKTGKT